MKQRIQAVFRNRADAEQAMNELLRAGVEANDVSIAPAGAVVTVSSSSSELRQRLQALQPVSIREYAENEEAWAERAPLPMYPAQSIDPPGAGSHQMATGDATREEDAFDRRVKNDAGPEHWAPVNREFSSSFDEFAGIFARDESVFLGDRAGPDYDRYKQAYDFGHRSAEDKRFTGREWVDAAGELRREWDQTHDGQDAEPMWAFVKKGWTAARGSG